MEMNPSSLPNSSGNNLAQGEMPEKHGEKKSPFERFTHKASDGFNLAAVKWLTPGTPRAVLILSHGMSEHAARYSPFAEACVAANIAVYGHDHRGHGDSVDVNTPRGHYADTDGWNKVVEDLHALRKLAEGAHPGVPVFLFGHSMGSFIGREYLVRYGSTLAGAVISATGVRLGPVQSALRFIAQQERRLRGGRTPSQLMSTLVFGGFNLRFLPSKTFFDWLTRDVAQVRAYINDPLCGFHCTTNTWDALFGGTRSVEQSEDEPSKLAAKLPLLLIAGTHDPVSMGGLGHKQLAARYRAAGNTNVTERYYPGGRHELVNEENRHEVFADVIGWIQQAKA